MGMREDFFIRRGEITSIIKFGGENLSIRLKIPTNYDHDQIMDEFTEMGADKSINVKAPDLIEERLIRFIIKLPFEIPVTEEMDQYKEWEDATHEEKRIAIRLMDPELRDKINNQLAITSELTESDQEN